MESLKMIDLNGEELVIKDLPAAIKYADRYRNYRGRHEHLKIYNESRRAYCEHVYTKLMLVKDIIHFN